MIVLASRTGCRLQLTPAQSPHKGIRNWIARINGEGIDAEVMCDEADWMPEYLSSFFGRLAADSSWRDEQTWRSAEGELSLSASHPKANTILVQATMNFRAPPVWTAEAEVEIDPGAFAQAADDLRREAERFPFR